MKNDLLANGRNTRNLKWRWEIHLQPFFGGKRAASITTADVKRFIVHRQQGKTLEQIRQELTALNNRHAAAIEAIQKSEQLSKREIRRLVREEVGRIDSSQARFAVRSDPKTLRSTGRRKSSSVHSHWLCNQESLSVRHIYRRCKKTTSGAVSSNRNNSRPCCGTCPSTLSPWRVLRSSRGGEP